MDSIVASRFSVIKPSPSMAAKARVDALRASGKSIIDFTLGEPDFDTPPHIVQAGIKALQLGQTRYTSSMGTPSLRAAIIQKLKNENGLTFTPNEVVVGVGAKHIIFTALMASLEPGDEVIIPAPYWVSYPDMVSINGGTPVIVYCPAASGFKLTPAQLEAAVTDKTRWLILNTPGNPTGAVYSADELSALGEVLRRHERVWLMSDEIYEHFVYGAARHVAPLAMAPYLSGRALVINGLSKAYAMTGWRLGYGAGPESLIKAINLVITQSTTCASAVSQFAGIEALTGPQACVEDVARAYQQRRDCIVSLLNAIPGIECLCPDGAFYVFPSVAGLLGKRAATGETLHSDIDVMNDMLDHGVALIDGTSYGMAGHLRISFATSTDMIEEGCARIGQAVRALS